MFIGFNIRKYIFRRGKNRMQSSSKPTELKPVKFRSIILKNTMKPYPKDIKRRNNFFKRNKIFFTYTSHSSKRLLDKQIF